tara:strand:+ start:475 stop:1515 length:1041 start_codon:yes stop_codon:yes gene_type:complete
MSSITQASQNEFPPVTNNPEESVQELAQVKNQVMNEIGKRIIGQQTVMEQILTAFFAGGHCLLEGVPGLAKTLMISTLSETLSLAFKRVQFTPDLMPSDVTGTNILDEDPETGRRKFTFNEGPIFTNVLLADEINRTPPKTQAALLEAMAEGKVTASGKTYDLPEPFLVLATQNPLEQEGTYMLPEAQMDRFIFLVLVDYPSQEEEDDILRATTSNLRHELSSILTAEDILNYQRLVRDVPISDHVISYASRLTRATRPKTEDAPDFIKNWLRVGCGPRAGQALILAAKAHAVLNGRFNVSIDDVRRNAHPVMRHRITLNFAAVSEGMDADAVITRLIEELPESAG